MVSFAYANTSFGGIGVSGGNNLYISGTATDHAGLTFATQAVLPTTQGAINNNTVDLGQNGNAFKDLYLSGGVVFGDAGGSGTSTSNTLDSYEEGTFTPSLPNGATYTVQLGKYTKIGDLVHIEIILGWSSNGYDNDFKINGLPFTPNGIPTFAIFNNGKTGIGSNKWNPESSGGTIYLRQSDATTGNSSVVSLATNDATSAFRITGSYKTNQ